MKRSLLVLVVILLANHTAANGDDYIRQLQTDAVHKKSATWGHWGPNPKSYSSWTSHSNRLIPIYTFGVDLKQVSGANSVYRDEAKLRQLYGYVPTETVNPQADYFDQTDVYKVQEQAIKAGKRCVVLFIFDGMDWQSTWAAALYKSKKVAYHSGRGTGLHFQDYRGAPTDFGFFVTSPHNEGTNINVNDQKVKNAGGNIPGGYCARIAGSAPWDSPTDPQYLIGKGAQITHAYVDSAAAATALTTGVKTYNDSINVDPYGRQVPPISQRLQQEGFSVGVVTSVPISHATPACGYANNVHRDDYQDLTRDMLGLASISHPSPLPGLDVLLGGGWGEEKKTDGAQGMNFEPGNRYFAESDRRRVDSKNGGPYVIAERTAGANGAELLAAATKQAIADKKRLLGIFGVKGGHLPFATADGQYDPTISTTGPAEQYSSADKNENPSLEQLTTSALDVLASRSDKFWLLVEAGDVDWGNHANNIDNSIGSVISGDEAFHATTQWIEKHIGWEQAAVIVTADHGHYLFIDQPEVLAGK